MAGPPGSGKSTTIYASLVKLISSYRMIVTVEDQIGYPIEGINQILVNLIASIDFPSGLVLISDGNGQGPQNHFVDISPVRCLLIRHQTICQDCLFVVRPLVGQTGQPSKP